MSQCVGLRWVKAYSHQKCSTIFQNCLMLGYYRAGEKCYYANPRHFMYTVREKFSVHCCDKLFNNIIKILHRVFVKATTFMSQTDWLN